VSQLELRTNNFGTFKLNVLSFSSPIFGSISSAQTKNLIQWYPIKGNQPDIQFDVQFISEYDYETFQTFIRDAQKWALTARKPMIYLNWPERNINNWSGMISEFVCGGMRFNPAPMASFVVNLVDSYVSEYTEMSSLVTTYEKAFPIILQGFMNLLPNPYNFRLPSLPSLQQNYTPEQPTGSGQTNNQNINTPPTIQNQQR
jgi:hypothetical protein